MASVSPVPEGFHTVTPHLIIKGAGEALDFYQKAFGAREGCRMPGPDGKIWHAEMAIGDSHVFLADEFPEWGVYAPSPDRGSPVTIHLYVPDADALFEQAVAAGAEAIMPLVDAFWGDRYGKVKDPYGHVWAIATHKEDIPPDELPKRAEAAMSGA